MTDEEYAVVEKMEKYGGSFVKALAVCFHKADNANFNILKKAFSVYWETYTENEIEKVIKD